LYTCGADGDVRSLENLADENPAIVSPNAGAIAAIAPGSVRPPFTSHQHEKITHTH
jgi:hypothetical protein